MKRLSVLLFAFAALSLANLAACTESPSGPDIEQGGDDEPGEEPENPGDEPENPGEERPRLTGITITVQQITLNAGESVEVAAVIQPEGAAFAPEEFMLTKSDGSLSDNVIISERRTAGDSGMVFVISDHRSADKEYSEQLRIIHQPTGISSATFSVSSTPLKYTMPVVRIYTTDDRSTITKDTWVDGEIEIEGGSAFADIARMKTQVKGRGNSTWHYVKKPYALKLDKKQEVLGMPKHKRWCLIANWLDNTHMRNRIAYYIGQNTHLPWTPRNEYAEVYFNGEYLGFYQVTEQIKVDENRVNVPELDPSDIGGDAVTGGYLLELDTYFDEAYRFRTESTRIPVNMKSPDENVPDAQMQYIRDYMNAIDEAMLALWEWRGTADKIYEYVDRRTMIDFWIVSEVMCNYEILHPKSLYFHKQRNGKLFAGPLWDFDYATLVPSRAQKWSCFGLMETNGVEWSWYERNWFNILMTRDQSLQKDVRERWNELYPFLQTVPSFIDAERERIAEAVARNNTKGWRNSGYTPNEDSGKTFDASVSQLKNTYKTRIEWLNTQINKWEWK